MSSLAKLKARRAENLSKGLCGSCSRPAVEGMKLCEEHVAYHRRKRAEATRARKAAGLCIDCGAPTSGGAVLCAEHVAKRADRWAQKKKRAAHLRANLQAWEAARVAAGLCAAHPSGRSGPCPRPIAPGQTRCAEHLDETRPNRLRAEAAKKRAGNGKCSRCGWPAPVGKYYCRDCTIEAGQANTARRAERRAQGLCRCGRKLRTEHGTCSRCRRQAARRARKRVRECRALGLCVTCRAPALPGSYLCEVHAAKHRKYHARSWAREKRRRSLEKENCRAA